MNKDESIRYTGLIKSSMGVPINVTSRQNVTYQMCMLLFLWRIQVSFKVWVTALKMIKL